MMKSLQLFGLSFLLLSQLVPPHTSVSAGEISNNGTCNVLGRVLESEDPGIKNDSVLCEGGQINVSDGKSIYLNCYGRSEYQYVHAGQHSIDRLCVVDRDARSECWGKPCTRSGGKIALLSPRSSTVLSTPRLEWTPHEGAVTYEIFVGSFGEERFHGKTQDTTFDLARHYSLRPGSIYRVDIYATNNKRVLEHSQFALRMPTNEEIQEMHKTIEIVKSRDIPELDKIRMIDSAYYTIGLLEQSIAYLKSIRQDFKNSVLVSSLLADRLAEAGYMPEAKEKYKYVNNNTEETSEDNKFAKKMLARIALLEESKASFP